MTTEPSTQPAIDWPTRIITLFGLGYAPIAPGTVACLPVVVLVLLLARILGGDQWATLNRAMLEGSIALLAVIGFIASVRFGNRAEQHFGRKDPSPVVMDEVAGQSIALLWLPWRVGSESRALAWNLLLAFTAFFAFRLFDILKPPPARGLQRLWGGWGIVMDDIAAGLYALAATQLLVRFVYA